jgi:hypothetical protein
MDSSSLPIFTLCYLKKLARIQLFTLVILLIIFPARSSRAQEACKIIPQYYEKILKDIADKKPDVLSSLYDCFRRDRVLILRAVAIDPSQFQYADEALQEDQVFILRLLKVTPQVLQFAAPEVRSDQAFMEKATYINRYSLQFASWTLLDNKLFMKRMIDIDPLNYKYASDRLKLLNEFAARAFSDNGLLLEFAPTQIRKDKKLVKIAVGSNAKAFEFVDESLKSDKELIKLATNISSVKSPEELKKFIEENYVEEPGDKDLAKKLVNKAKFFPDHKIIDQKYITKWKMGFDNRQEYWRLTAADNKNRQKFWKKDFKNYPELIAKIERFLVGHNVAENNVNNMVTTYLWKVKDKPNTLVFNLYLVNESADRDLGSEYVNVTSITAIAQKHGNKWSMTIIEVVFDSEEKSDVSYEDGLKRYEIWDLYRVGKSDSNPKVIFKVSEKFGDYFEVFEEQSNGKYHKILSTK